ncbi:UNVERIFIED_CONTAM: MFS transporter [Actinomycetes bacterium ARC8]|nr:MFS transporter [Actinomycetes bacterium ARC8]
MTTDQTPLLERQTAAAGARRLPALRHQRGYRIWWVADTTALLAGGIYSFVLPLILLGLTGSTVQAGTLAALGLAARASLTLLGGSVADRSDRACMMLTGGICGAALTAALAVAGMSGSLSVAVLCVAHVLMELRSGYFGAVTNAALKDVVHPKQLGRAMAANQGRDSVLMLGAAPLGGLLLGLGAGFALLAVSFLQLLAAASGFALRGPLRAAEASSKPMEHSPAGSRPVSSGIAAGMRWCFARPQLRSLLILITVINIGTNGLNTTLIYGLQQRGESPWVIGLVSTFMGLGMFAGSLFAGRMIEKFRTGVLACSCLSVLGGAMLLMGFNTNLIWLGSMLLMAYLSVPALNASVGGYFMAVVPREMAGRANSLILFMALSALPLAPFFTGLGLQWLGMGPTLLFFGSLVIVATVAAWCSGHVRGIPHPDHWSSEPASANSQIEVEAKESAGLVSAEDEPTQVQGEPSMKNHPASNSSVSSRRLGLRRTPSSVQRNHHVPSRVDLELRAQRERVLSSPRNEQWIHL